jgi:hypothetical protein
VGVNVVVFTTTASVGAGAVLNSLGASTGSVTLAAEAKLGVQNLAAAGALGSSVGVGAAVAVNVLTVTTKAFFDTNADVDAAEQLSLSATASLVGEDVFASDVPLIGNINVNSVAIGGAASNGGTAVGGSVVVNVFPHDTGVSRSGRRREQKLATVPGANQSVSIVASDGTDVGDGRAVSALAAGSAGIGAKIVVSADHEDVRAYVGKART